jgi:flagellar M-ring protein FliF
VTGLRPQRVSIVDEAGRLLADGAADDPNGSDVTADDRRAAFEKRMREQIEAIISSVVGPGRARVQITADFDFNRITQTSDKFDPEGRVVRSSQTREESSATSDGKENQVTVANELPGTGQRQGAAPEAPPAAPRDQNKKSEEIINYEISRTTKTEVIEGGRINRISVAVLVDGTYGKNDKGETVYQPRSKEEIDRIAALVRTAIGFDQKRGDQVEVVNLRFAESPAVQSAEPAGWLSYLQFTKDDIMRAVELAVMAMLGLIVLFLVVRPLVRRILKPEETGTTALPLSAAAGGTLSADASAVPAVEGGEPIPAAPSQTAKMIDIAKVQGQVHAQSVQKVGELADKNPHETVFIIRQWLHESTA